MNAPTMRSIALATLVTLSACTSLPERPSSPQTTKTISRFGVVSAVATNLNRQYVGATVFGNERDVRNIEPWAIDQNYEAQFGAAVETLTGGSFVKASTSTVDFFKASEPNGFWKISSPNWDNIEGLAKATCQALNVDSLFVVARRRSTDIFGGTNQVVMGLGIYSRGGKSILHLLAEVALFDCKSAKLLKTKDVVLSRPIAEELARIPTADWTSEAERLIRGAVVALPGRAWEVALKDLLL